jgi:hypothetical protein
MWESRRLTTLWAFTACYRDSFNFFFYLYYDSSTLGLLSNGDKFPLCCRNELQEYMKPRTPKARMRIQIRTNPWWGKQPTRSYKEEEKAYRMLSHFPYAVSLVMVISWVKSMICWLGFCQLRRFSEVPYKFWNSSAFIILFLYNLLT